MNQSLVPAWTGVGGDAMALNAWRCALAFAVISAALGAGHAAFGQSNEPIASIDGDLKPLPDHVIMLKKLVKMAVFLAAGILAIIAGVKASELALPLNLRRDVAEGKNAAAGLVFAGLAVAIGIAVFAALSAV